MNPITILVDDMTEQVAEVFDIDLSDEESAQFVRSYAFRLLEDRALAANLALQYAAEVIDGSLGSLGPIDHAVLSPGLMAARDFLLSEAHRDPLSLSLETMEVTVDSFSKDPYDSLRPGDDTPREIVETATWCGDNIISPRTEEEFVCERPAHNPLFKHVMADETGEVVIACWQNGVIEYEPDYFDEVEDDE